MSHPRFLGVAAAALYVTLAACGACPPRSSEPPSAIGAARAAEHATYCAGRWTLRISDVGGLYRREVRVSERREELISTDDWSCQSFVTQNAVLELQCTTDSLQQISHVSCGDRLGLVLVDIDEGTPREAWLIGASCTPTALPGRNCDGRVSIRRVSP